LARAAVTNRFEQTLEELGWCIGEVAILRNGEAFALRHRDDAVLQLQQLECATDAVEIARFDDARKFRPLKTAPNLRHGWRIECETLREVELALEDIYPGRLAALREWRAERLTATPLRTTLNRQSGMYRVAAKISDEQIDDVVFRVCRSDGGCLRTILWRRDEAGALPSRSLAPSKFDPAYDQTGRDEKCAPLLCQEACAILIASARDAVKAE
jgi:sirohydrochlorin cobaltochelatase